MPDVLVVRSLSSKALLFTPAGSCSYSKSGHAGHRPRKAKPYLTVLTYHRESKAATGRRGVKAGHRRLATALSGLENYFNAKAL